jgi:asparagine synthase (glutamine-hydrolysing)
MAAWGRDGFGEWREGACVLGQARTYVTPECRFEALPSHDHVAGFVFTAAGRLDNREALLHVLGLRDRDSGRRELADGDVLMAAYRRWGEDAPARVFGDWSFAAWHPRERKLFLARDHFGETALYYYADARTFAFASSQQALLSLGIVPAALDELYLAQYLVSWPAYLGERTPGSAIRRLPPAHALTLTPERLEVRSYWRMEDVSEQRLPRRSDYVGALGEVFDEAVRTRLRSCGPVGAMLSGGLDSSSVAATATGMLRERGERLRAFTSVPVYDTQAYVGERFGDELPLASATAALAGNVDVHAIDAQRVSPIAGIRRGLELFGEPVHGAGNMFWIVDLHDAAQRAGCRVLLSGQMGNAGISWSGSTRSQPLSYRLRRLGARGLLKERLKRGLPRRLRAARARRRIDPEWYRGSAIHPALARRLELAERRLEDPDTFPRSPVEERLSILMPGRGRPILNGAVGHDLRDPTADVRLVSFALSVPDRVFIDPETGLDRWLIREAMRDRLPDRVRLNPGRGRQAGDLVPRLRATAGEVEAALEQVASGPAAGYVDVPYMREVWRMIQREDTPEAFRKAITVLTRGIMAGLYVNSVDNGTALDRGASTIPAGAKVS